MKKTIIRSVLTLFIMVLFIVPNFAVENDFDFVEDELFIKVYDRTSPEEANLLIEYLYKGVNILNKGTVYFKMKETTYDIKNLFLFSLVNNQDEKIELTLEEMNSLRNTMKEFEIIYYTQPNYKYRKHRGITSKAEVKTDSLGIELEAFNELWAFQNDGGIKIGQDYYDEREGVEGMDINIVKAWEITRGLKDVIVMIADDGLDVSHLEFKGRIIQKNLYNPQLDIGVEDGYGDIQAGHGTHVAGIIAASWHDGYITGVAPNVTLLPINILSNVNDSELMDAYGTSDSAISSVFIAKEYGVKVINNSWGSERWTLDEESGEKILYDEWDFDMVLREAIQSVENEILYVVAAGNDGHNNDLYPSVPDMFGSERIGPDGLTLQALKNVISVAALDNSGSIVDYSNYGQNSVHISAPGWGIYSTYPLDQYIWFDGTSMAAPMVSGVAALMYSVNPDLTPEEVINIILESGRDLPYANDYNKTISDKMLDAYAAVKAAKDQYDQAQNIIDLKGVSTWAVDEVNAAIDYDLVTMNVLMDFQLSISRIDFAQLIIKFYETMSENKASIPLNNPFEDTNDTEILKAYSLEIIKGKTASIFAPEDEISRQEMAVMFYRTLRAINPKLTNGNYDLEFEDEILIASWAEEAMAYMSHFEIINGIGNNLLDPLGSSSKEVAILLVLRTYLEFRDYVDL